MAFTIRLAADADMAECIRVENESTPGYTYLADAWQTFKSSRGGCVCVYDEGKMIGIGRFTVLPDGSGWLETLRVSKEHQRKGAGKAIYQKYIELARQFSCPSMAMYTGERNIASSHLAEIFGLRTAARHRLWRLSSAGGGCAHHFRPVSPVRAAGLILPQRAEYNDHMVFNRTFYHINEANALAFAAEGKVFEDSEDGSFIVCGARFQHSSALHIAMMGGDHDRCIDFALQYASAIGVPELNCTFTLENESLENALKKRGFTQEGSEIITKEIVF